MEANLAVIILALAWPVIDAAQYKWQVGARRNLSSNVTRCASSRLECGMLCAEATICWAFNFNRKRDSCEMGIPSDHTPFIDTDDQDWTTAIKELGRCKYEVTLIHTCLLQLKRPIYVFGSISPQKASSRKHSAREEH